MRAFSENSKSHLCLSQSQNIEKVARSDRICTLESESFSVAHPPSTMHWFEDGVWSRLASPPPGNHIISGRRRAPALTRKREESKKVIVIARASWNSFVIAVDPPSPSDPK